MLFRKENTVRKLAIAGLVLLLTLSITFVALASTIHWTYEGEEGPAHWGELSPDFAACSAGLQQSPIDIPAGAPVNPADIVFNYSPSALTVVNNGHTIQANYDAGSTITIDGMDYQLLQFHFHGDSEHTVAGQHSPMEAHFVHGNAAGQLAVVGVMLKEGDANVALEPVFANMPAEKGDPVAVAGATVSAGDVLPVDRSYYRYDGSLTTPPCTEGVKWFVMANAVTISAGQQAAYTDLHADNYRPVQAMNARSFYLGGAPEGLPVTGGLMVVGVLWMTVASGLVVLSIVWVVRRRREGVNVS